MGWSEIPVSGDAFIHYDQFKEVMDKIRLLWNVHPNAWYYNPSWHKMEPEPLPEDGPHGKTWWYYRYVTGGARFDVGGFRFYGNVIGWFRRILEDMHDTTLGKWSQTWGLESGRMYESGGVPVYRDLDWVLDACGVGSWSWLTWGRQMKSAGGMLSEIKTVMDYIKDYAIVATRTGFTGTGYGHMDAYLKGWTSPDTETSWSGARARATGDMNVHFHAPYNGITSWLGAQLGMPFVSMMLRNNGGEWEPYYWFERYNCMKEKHNNGIVGPHGRRCSSAGWHADLKRSGCEYWLKFKSGGINYNYCGLLWATNPHAGMVAMPYELNGVDIEGGAPANGGAWDSSGRTVPFDYADWDWVNDRGDIFFDDSALSFPIPPACGTPAAWSDGSVDYYEGSTVSHGGSTYVALQGHTSSAGTEPGTGGGDAYWVLAFSACWDGADSGDVTGFVWSQPAPYTIYVKPSYADY